MLEWENFKSKMYGGVGGGGVGGKCSRGKSVNRQKQVDRGRGALKYKLVKEIILNIHETSVLNFIKVQGVLENMRYTNLFNSYMHPCK